MKNSKYSVGKPVAFIRDDDIVTIGVIKAVNIVLDKYEYEIEELADENDNIEHHIIKEDNIIEPPPKEPLRCSDWVKEHMEEINKAFGRDISKYALVIDYDNLKKMKHDWGEDCLSEFKEYIRIVDKKFVMIAC